ncbi:MAG: hypothetical protein AAFN50_03035 [Pseudomonadota bacterium]
MTATDPLQPFANLLSKRAKTSVLSRFPNILICFACVIMASGCASSAPSEYQILASSPTPQIWKESPKWQFHFIDPDGNWLGSMDLMFGEEQADTCTSGDWGKATVLRSSVKEFAMTGFAFTGSGGDSDVAYEINGANLWIDLHARICDSNIMLQGKLLESGATGEVRYSTPFPAKDDNGDRGTFTAAPLVTE